MNSMQINLLKHLMSVLINTNKRYIINLEMDYIVYLYETN